MVTKTRTYGDPSFKPTGRVNADRAMQTELFFGPSWSAYITSHPSICYGLENFPTMNRRNSTKNCLQSYKPQEGTANRSLKADTGLSGKPTAIP